MREFELVRSDSTVWIVRRDEHGVVVEVREAQDVGEPKPATRAALLKFLHRHR
jgi:hypothetical protein